MLDHLFDLQKSARQMKGTILIVAPISQAFRDLRRPVWIGTIYKMEFQYKAGFHMCHRDRFRTGGSQ